MCILKKGFTTFRPANFVAKPILGSLSLALARHQSLLSDLSSFQFALPVFGGVRCGFVVSLLHIEGASNGFSSYTQEDLRTGSPQDGAWYRNSE